MQPCKSPFSFSLSFNVARALQHATLARMVSAISFLRTRQTASSSCKFFQLIPTSCNYFQLLFSCLLLNCALVLSGCDWSWLLPPSCNFLHLLAVKLCTDFYWLQLVATASSYLQIYSPACCLNCALVLTDCNYFQLISATCQIFSACHNSLQFLFV